MRKASRFGAPPPPLLLVLMALAPWSPGATPVAAEPAGLSVSASLDPAEIRIGDEARLTVVVEHAAGGAPELPEIGLGKAVVVGDRRQRTEAHAEGRERTTVEIRLTSFVVGEHRIGDGTVSLAGGGAKGLVQPFPLTVLRTRSVLRSADTPQRGIRGPVRWPVSRNRLMLLAAGLAALALAGAIAVRLRRSGRRGGAAPATRPVAPHERALKALAALRGAGPLEGREAEPLYREISDIVRRYLEERFGLRAPDRTTEEFIREAVESGLLAPAHQDLVRAFLERCDLVKFARWRPLPEEATRAFEAAVRLVRETRPTVGEGGGP